ncbi:MAG TPA: O-succinylhomoserine sulfhydrylase [Hyphomonas atlantica]|uniref:O-succinylhomoserine sulfhydrylase n=1 Tax=Hyphomonas atlantica TaxID=1280948 RepID=A0A3B9L4Y8_9PROT|nr:O-succinylhomoserine sulfhydrylase [Hyphomonas atlantica]|tara:strand:+ start:816 stop:2018 length:1203 start_codon:yes stop_codon:yes gene_type:complete
MADAPGENAKKGWKPATQAVRGGLMRSEHGEISEALYLTSGYSYDSAEQAMRRMAGEEDGFVYSRYGSPTCEMLQQRLALIEGAETCRVAASGMGAISTAILAPLKAGDRVVAATALFGSCRWIIANQMPKFGIETVFVDGADLEAWEREIAKGCQLVLIESPANPLLDGVDIEAVAKLCKAAGATLVVDNVFATPILQKPLELGADVVVYSTTKHMDGQGRVMGGAILCDSARMEEIYDPWLRHLGPAASPFNAWVVLKGLETLKLRVDQQTRNAARLADVIADHPAIAAVRYPHREDHPHYEIHKRQMSAGGTMIAFSLKGSQAEAFKFLNALELVDICNNLGDTKTLACHPSSTTHRALSDEEQASMGLDRSWIRMSVGLEDSDDLVMDLTRALNSV